MTGRMEVVGRVSGRRRWSDEEKLEILADAFRPGVRVCDVIARRQVSSSLIYTWRKQLREGKLACAVPSLPVFAEVQLAGPVVPTPQPAPCSSGLIRIELPGGARVNVDAGVDADALARVPASTAMRLTRPRSGCSNWSASSAISTKICWRVSRPLPCVR